MKVLGKCDSALQNRAPADRRVSATCGVLLCPCHQGLPLGLTDSPSHLRLPACIPQGPGWCQTFTFVSFSFLQLCVKLHVWPVFRSSRDLFCDFPLHILWLFFYLVIFFFLLIFLFISSFVCLTLWWFYMLQVSYASFRFVFSFCLWCLSFFFFFLKSCSFSHIGLSYLWIFFSI